MATLTTKETQTSAGEQECGICYTDLNNKNTVITTCNHAYCTACFFNWLGRKETCALCRKVLLTDTMVEERLTDLQDVQSELMENYRCLRVLKKNVKKKKRKKKNLADDVNSLINRQIRMRSLLEQTRSECRETLAHNRALKRARQVYYNKVEEVMEEENEEEDLMKNYRNEWEELHTPLPLSPSPSEEEEEEEEEEEINIVNMTTELDNMVRLESRRARTALQRMREVARAAAETIGLGSSDEDDNTAHEIEDPPTRSYPPPLPPPTGEEIENDSTDSDVNDEEGMEVDLTVFGTGIPTFDFTTPSPRRTVIVPRRPLRNHRQSPMFIFGANETPPVIASAFEMPTDAESPVPSTTQSTTLPLTPPIIEMTRTQIEPPSLLLDSLHDSDFEWTSIMDPEPRTRAASDDITARMISGNGTHNDIVRRRYVSGSDPEMPGSDAMTLLFARPEMEPELPEEKITDE